MLRYVLPLLLATVPSAADTVHGVLPLPPPLIPPMMNQVNLAQRRLRRRVTNVHNGVPNRRQCGTRVHNSDAVACALLHGHWLLDFRTDVPQVGPEHANWRDNHYVHRHSRMLPLKPGVDTVGNVALLQPQDADAGVEPDWNGCPYPSAASRTKPQADFF